MQNAYNKKVKFYQEFLMESLIRFERNNFVIKYKN